MNTARFLSAREYDRLAAGTRLLVQRCGGPSGAAEITRVDAPRLSRYGAPHEDRTFIPLDVVADLEASAGDPTLTRILADLSGYTITPKVVRSAPGDILAAGGAVTNGVAAVIGNLMRRLSDGELDMEEARATRRDIAAAYELLAILDAKAGAVCSSQTTSKQDSK